MDPYLTLSEKLDSTWIKTSNIRNTVKLELKHISIFHDVGIVRVLEYDQKAQTTTIKINKWDCSKLTTFYIA